MGDKPETIMYISVPPALLSNGLSGYETDHPSGHMYPDKDWPSVQNIAMCYNIILGTVTASGKATTPSVQITCKRIPRYTLPRTQHTIYSTLLSA